MAPPGRRDDPLVGTAQLLGRESELSLLANAVATTRAGAGGVVLLEGPAGIGKSRLLDEAGRGAADAGFVVAAARSDELDQVTALGPLLTALRAGDPPVLAGTDLDSLRLMDQRLWILDRLRAILEAEAHRHPLLISIDDIQWADGATLHALATLPGQLFSVPVLWLLARRPAPTSAAMQIALARLGDVGARRLRVDPLAPDATTALAAASLGARPDSTLGQMIDEVGGNPFYLLELLRGLSEAGRIVRRGRAAHLVAGDLPETFRVAVATHTRGLPPLARRLVEVASVFGRDFALTDVAAVMHVAPVALVEPTSDAIRAELLVERGELLAFRHDLVRHAIYDGLATSVRRALHREAASALRLAGAPVSHVAIHISLSARPGDDEAVQTLTEAAAALAPTNPVAAADLAARAVDLVPAGDPRRRDVGTYAVELLGRSGRLEQARTVAEAILSDATLDAARQAAIHLGIRRSWVMTTRNRIDWPIPAEVWGDPTVAPEVRAMLLALEASSMGHTDLAGAARLVADARRESSRSGDADAEMLVAAVAAGVAFPGGHLEIALDFALEADRLRGRASYASQSYPRWFVAFCLCPLDRLHEADRLFIEAYRAGEKLGSPFDMSLAEASRSAALLALGRFDDAATTAESATDIAVPLGLGQPLGEARRVLTEVHIRRGDLAAAKVVVRHLEPLLASGAATATAAWAAALLAEAQRDPRRAIAALAEPIALLHDGQYRIGVPDPPQLAHLSAMAIAAGEPTTAALASAAAEDLAVANGNRPNLAGVAAHARGLVEGDEEELVRAVELLGRGERPLAIAAAEEALGAMQAEHERTGAAGVVLHSAHERYAACGAHLDAARVRSRLRRLGIRTQRPDANRPTDGWNSLTPSELSVCRAVADGLTSNDVAARLYLSVNTVNTHLRHAFTKLGIKSRVELARLAARREPDEWTGVDPGRQA